MADGSEEEEPWPDNEEKFYDDAKEYWASINPSVDGMLGGFEKISPTDINGSKAFLRPFLKIITMDCEKVIATVKDMELQLLGVVHKINNGKIQEATVFLEKIARKTKCDGLTLEIRNKKHMEQLQSLTEENKMLKDKLKYTETTKSKALQENGLLQVKLACKERELEELKAKVQMLEKEIVNSSSQDVFNEDFNEDIANKSEESELEQEMTPKSRKQHDNFIKLNSWTSILNIEYMDKELFHN